MRQRLSLTSDVKTVPWHLWSFQMPYSNSNLSLGGCFFCHLISLYVGTSGVSMVRWTIVKPCQTIIMDRLLLLTKMLTNKLYVGGVKSHCLWQVMVWFFWEPIPSMQSQKPLENLGCPWHFFYGSSESSLKELFPTSIKRTFWVFPRRRRERPSNIVMPRNKAKRLTMILSKSCEARHSISCPPQFCQSSLHGPTTRPSADQETCPQMEASWIHALPSHWSTWNILQPKSSWNLLGFSGTFLPPRLWRWNEAHLDIV